MKERIESMLEDISENKYILGMIWSDKDPDFSERLLSAARNNIALILAEFEGLENAFRAERDAKIRLAAEVKLLKERLKAITE